MAEHKRQKEYAGLDRLSIEELEELLYEDFISPDQGDTALVLAVLEELEKREQAEPTGRLPDVDQAWAEFQTFIRAEERRSIRPESRLRVCLRWAATAAAVVLVIFGGMVTAEISGMEPFGALLGWTNNVTISNPVSLWPATQTTYMAK